MTQKKYIKIVLVCGLTVISIGGWLLHYRVHPPSEEAANYLPFLIGIISIVIIPVMFLYRKTMAYAYVINSMIVIIGTITMAHFSLTHLIKPVTLYTIIFNTTLSDIAILWTKFALGRAIFELELLQTNTDLKRKGRYFRYPNTGWWLVHLAGMSIVYALGNILWI